MHQLLKQLFLSLTDDQAQCNPLPLQEEHALASGVHITADAASAGLGGSPASADCIAPAVQAVRDLT